jgi:hypothetical protein
MNCNLIFPTLFYAFRITHDKNRKIITLSKLFGFKSLREVTIVKIIFYVLL